MQPLVISSLKLLLLMNSNLTIAPEAELVSTTLGDLPCCGCDQVHHPECTEVLDGRGFTLLNWNIYKGQRTNLSTDLARFAESSDLLVLQEARVNPNLNDLLDRYHWHLGKAFTLEQDPVGVLTASRFAAADAATFRMPEPWIKVPKMAVVTEYPLAGTEQTLLVANIHAVNFSLGLRSYLEQLGQLRDKLRHHGGPLILSGDFNTWSRERMAALEGLTVALDLEPVLFDQDRRTNIMGRPIDHIFYRGLNVEAVHSHQVSSSDHNPMQVRFALPPEGLTLPPEGLSLATGR